MCQTQLLLANTEIVAFQETEFSNYLSVLGDDTPIINQLAEWGLEVFQRTGANPSIGLDLYGTFVDVCVAN